MKASEVRILPALDAGESYVEPSFVLVETALDESGGPVTTIEHVASFVVGDKLRWQVTTLGQSVALTHASALEWAVSFAATRQRPDRLPARREPALCRYTERAARIGRQRVKIVAGQTQLLVSRLGAIDDGAKCAVLGAIFRIPG